MPEIVGRLRTPRLPGAPASPVVGEVYYDTTTNILYWWNGTAWFSAKGGGGVDYIGTWSAAVPYKAGDVVTHGGRDYLAVNPSTGQTPPAPGSGTSSGGGSPWQTGDEKISAIAATHADPLGGTWYLADGSAVPPANTALVALLGANFPDARGRSLVMLGTHADVNAIGKVEQAALSVGSRRMKHSHTKALTVPWGNVGGSGLATPNTNYQGDISVSGTIGVAGAGIDEPAFVVIGNLFYHS